MHQHQRLRALERSRLPDPAAAAFLRRLPDLIAALEASIAEAAAQAVYPAPGGSITPQEDSHDPPAR